MISRFRDRASVGAMLGGFAVLLGLIVWVLLLIQELTDLDLTLFDNLLKTSVLILAGPVLSSVGLTLSITAMGGARKRHAIVGLILNLLALVILAYPVFLLLLALIFEAFGLPIDT